MTINDHLTEFAGLPVTPFAAGDSIHSPQEQAFRLALDWEQFENDESFFDLLAEFVADENSTNVRALIIGDWGGAGQGEDSASAVEALVSARNRLPNLSALFLGEMICEESEISWIIQTDISPLFEAFPNLETLCVRGGSNLRLGSPRHARLRELVIESGGLPAPVLGDVASAQLPALVKLELWLGTDHYGNDSTDDDIRRLLQSSVCQQLTSLGLRDDVRADDTAKVLAAWTPPASLQALDISLGTLSDDGANVLAECGWLSQLQKLDMHYHFCSPAAVARLKSRVPNVDDSDLQDASHSSGESYRYVAVSE